MSIGKVRYLYRKNWLSEEYDTKEASARITKKRVQSCLVVWDRETGRIVQGKYPGSKMARMIAYRSEGDESWTEVNWRTQ